ncbi:MAG: hypothetical protein R3F17_01095 [Planctomycetota bacterium]
MKFRLGARGAGSAGHVRARFGVWEHRLPVGRDAAARGVVAHVVQIVASKQHHAGGFFDGIRQAGGRGLFAVGRAGHEVPAEGLVLHAVPEERFLGGVFGQRAQRVRAHGDRQRAQFRRFGGPEGDLCGHDAGHVPFHVVHVHVNAQDLRAADHF